MKDNKKLSDDDYKKLLGDGRATKSLDQDKRLAEVYTDVERRIDDMRDVRRAVRQDNPDEAFDDLTGEIDISAFESEEA